MSASVVEQILARVAACLAAAGLSVFRGRVDAFEDDELPAVNVKRVASSFTVTDVAGEVSQAEIEFEVEFHVAALAGVETSADALHQAAHLALMDDATLAAWGKSSLRCVDTALDQDRADQAAACLVARYRIDAWVLQRDLSTFQ